MIQDNGRLKGIDTLRGLVMVLMFGSNDWPANYEPQLWLVFAAFVTLLALFYPLCRWFGAVKQQRRDSWLSWL